MKKQVIIFLLLQVVAYSIFAQDQDNSEYLNKYNQQDTLTVNDCEDIGFIRWLFTQETGLGINDKDIQLVKNDYRGGIPVTVTQLPYYYRIELSKSEYKKLKKQLKKNEYWEINKKGISFLRVTKFYCGCVIKENELIFGFSSIDIIQPFAIKP